MRVAVTGGTGFVGSHSTKALVDAGHAVRLLVRSEDRIRPALEPLGMGEVDFALGDVTDAASVRRVLDGCDAVLHCASIYSLDQRQAAAIRQTNVAGIETVIGVARELGLDPIVHVSSVVALAGTAGALLGPDSRPTRPRVPYARSKADSDRVARRHQREGAPVVISYPASVYGPFDPHWGEGPQLIANALRGFYRLMPKGALAMCDVDELARLHVALMEPGKGPRRYMAVATTLDGPAILAMLARLTGRGLKTTAVPFSAAYYPIRLLDAVQRVVPARLPLATEPLWFWGKRHRVDDSRTRQDFGIVPRPIEQTIEEMVRWMVSTGRLRPELAGRLRTSGPSA